MGVPAGEEQPARPRAMSAGDYVSCAGVVMSLLVYGLSQERIMTVPYGDTFFPYSISLVLCHRGVAIIFSIVMAMWSGEALCHQAPLWKYLVVSLLIVLATVCQYEALKDVSFVALMLARSLQMVPFWGILVEGSVRSGRDWAVAMAVAAGAAEFCATGPVTSPYGRQGVNCSRGVALLACFLLLDGITPMVQGRLFKEHAPSKYNLMMYINGTSAVLCLAALLCSRSLSPAFALIAGNPALLIDVASMSLSAVAGQYFTYTMVRELGVLTFAAVTNVRHIASIAASCVTFGHDITSPQVTSLAVVISALLYSSCAGRQEPTAKTEKDALLQNDRGSSV